MSIIISGTTGIDAGSLPVANTGKISAGSGLPVILNTAGVDRVTVDTSGNVGIGTSSPEEKLDIRFPAFTGQNQTHRILVQSLSNSTANTLGSKIGITFNGRNSTFITAGGASTASMYAVNEDNSIYSRNLGLAFYTSLMDSVEVERMRIDSAGRVTMPYQPAFIAVGISADVATNAPLVFVTNHASVPSQRSSGYSTSTGAFTAPVSGFYQFNFTAYDFNTGDKSIYEVRKNGGYYNVAGDHFQMQEATDAAMTTWSFNIYLQVNDYIQMGKRAGTLNLYSGHTMWSGYLIG